MGGVIVSEDQQKLCKIVFICSKHVTFILHVIDKDYFLIKEPMGLKLRAAGGHHLKKTKMSNIILKKDQLFTFEQVILQVVLFGSGSSQHTSNI